MKLLIFLVIFIFLSTSANAFKFSPMSTTLGVSKKDNTVLFYLENDSDQPIAVSLGLVTRVMDSDGTETNQSVSNELNVYPSQLIIPPNEKRSVKVSWLGKENPEKEKSYRLIAEQLPIELDSKVKKKASIKVLLRYSAALYVNSEEYSSDVKFEKMETNSTHVIFKINNVGKAHQVLSNLSMVIKNEESKKELKLTSDDLKGMTGENILALSERSFKFKKEGKFKDILGSEVVKINFEKD